MKDGNYYKISLAAWLYEKYFSSKFDSPLIQGIIREKIMICLEKLFYSTIPYVLIGITILCIFYFPIHTTKSENIHEFSEKFLYSSFTIGTICIIAIYRIGQLLRRTHWT